ncbi:MAG: YIP1 family protein [Candidatus Margulisiibacteriota bacterium]
MKNVNDLPFLAEAKDAIEILKLDKAKMMAVAANPAATKWGVFFLVVPAVVNLILSAISFPSGFGSILSRYVLWPTIIPVLSFVGGLYLIHVAATKLFKANADFWGFFRIASYSYLIYWLTLIPALLMTVSFFVGGGLGSLVSLVASIWTLVVAYHVMTDYYKLNQQNAILALIIGAVAFAIVGSILGGVLVGSYYKMY